MRIVALIVSNNTTGPSSMADHHFIERGEMKKRKQQNHVNMFSIVELSITIHTCKLIVCVSEQDNKNVICSCVKWTIAIEHLCQVDGTLAAKFLFAHQFGQCLSQY